MDHSNQGKPRSRAKPYTISLGPELSARVEAIRSGRRPSPPASALLRLLVETALPSFEGGVALGLDASPAVRS